jgi:competence protein ComEA
VEKEQFQKWFRFSKKERNGLLIFLFLVVSFFTIPYFLPKKIKENEANKKAIATSHEGSTHRDSLFTFDPNTLDKEGWLQLGLKEKTANTILHYCQKGGCFRHPEDIRKIYGLKSVDADKLIPYIQIENTQNPPHFSKTTQHFVSDKNVHFPIEINHAGWQHFAALPGMNDKLAQRITHYREAKHGFHSVEEIAKTYGLQPQLFEKIKPYLRCSLVVEKPIDQTTSLPSQQQTIQEQLSKQIATKKVNINSAILSEFMRTRKIPKSVAEAIIVYREQHGNYSSISEIKNIAFINNDLFDRISPYLKTEED